MSMGFSRFDNGFSLPFHFLDRHGVMGFFFGLTLDFWKFLEPGEAVLRKFPRFGVEVA